MSRIVMAMVLAPLLLLGCGGSDHSPWRVGEIHSDSLLTGSHAVLRCEACHGSAPYDRATADCYACHRADFESSSFDHALVGSSTTCAACHSPAGWSHTHFDHSLFRFPLSGSHLSVRCALCHIGGVWAGQPTDCKACHWVRRQDDPWNLALGDSCGDCHTTAGWAGAPFDHLARTGFPLGGAHARVPCLTCHPGRVPSGTPSGCYDCHRADFESSTFDHALVGSSTSCAACHSTAGWSPATFDHSLFNFPLTGLHVSVACASCHVGGTWAGQPTDCKACHWTRRQDDPWNLALGDLCGDCHTTAGWAGAPFDHLARTGFPLEARMRRCRASPATPDTIRAELQAAAMIAMRTARVVPDIPASRSSAPTATRSPLGVPPPSITILRSRSSAGGTAGLRARPAIRDPRSRTSPA